MNVKQGDMAIITRSKVPDAIGMVCEVLHFYGDVSISGFGAQPTWMIRLPRKIRCVGGDIANKVLCPDFALRPVSGLPDTEDTDTKEPIKEVA